MAMGVCWVEVLRLFSLLFVSVLLLLLILLDKYPFRPVANLSCNDTPNEVPLRRRFRLHRTRQFMSGKQQMGRQIQDTLPL